MHRGTAMVTASEHQHSRDDENSDHSHPASRHTWQRWLRGLRQSIFSLSNLSGNRGGPLTSSLPLHLPLPQKVVTTAVGLSQQWLQRIRTAPPPLATACLLLPLVLLVVMAYLTAGGGAGMLPFDELPSNWWSFKRQDAFVSE